MLQEISKDEWGLNALDSQMVLVYTNMCGTCERAKVMLNVVSETIKDVQFVQINANLNPSIISDYNITSIPCFLMFKEGKLVDQFYAFHSVTYLFNKIKGFTE